MREVLTRLSAQPAKADIELWSTDVVALLGAPQGLLAKVAGAVTNSAVDAGEKAGAVVLAPFEPRSFRDFMLYERHAINAARGFVRTFMPRVLPITRAYEAVTGRDFPMFRPRPLWHRQPIYYMGNHLAFVTDGAAVASPSYTHAFDYELELGFVLSGSLFNARPEEAETAIGGFEVLNDFGARDVQREEMNSGFGPQKAKHFASAISNDGVTRPARST